MDIQLQELIDKIKKDGIESAAADAERVKKQAQNEASRIVDAANKQAASIVAKAKEDGERFQKAGEEAVKQASRNIVLALKDEVQELVNKLTAQETARAYDASVLKEAIPALLGNWDFKEDKGIDVLLPQKDLDAVAGTMKGKLAAEIKKGLEFKPAKNISAGFRIVEKDGSAFYDFSADSVAECLGAYVNPKVAELLKDAAASTGDAK
jgi:V/A-type H+-transporting ATPase subunit E